MDRSNKQKINRETQTLNDTRDQLDLIDIYRTFHPQNNEFHLFLKCTWNLLQDRAINLALVNSKNTEIIPSIFSGYNAVRLNLNYKRKTI